MEDIMSNMLVPTKLYKEITHCLCKEGCISEVPALKWTTGKNWYGCLRGNRIITTNKYTGYKTVKWNYIGIYINKAYCPCTQKQAKENYLSLINLVDTICHELAHMTHHFEGGKHLELTEEYMNTFKHYLASQGKTIYSVIADCKEA